MPSNVSRAGPGAGWSRRRATQVVRAAVEAGAPCHHLYHGAGRRSPPRRSPAASRSASASARRATLVTFSSSAPPGVDAATMSRTSSWGIALAGEGVDRRRAHVAGALLGDRRIEHERRLLGERRRAAAGERRSGASDQEQEEEVEDDPARERSIARPSRTKNRRVPPGWDDWSSAIGTRYSRRDAARPLRHRALLRAGVARLAGGATRTAPRKAPCPA